MAMWSCYQNRRGNLSLLYRTSEQVHDCGEMRMDTPESMVLEWVLSRTYVAGDIIHLPSGPLLCLRPGVEDLAVPAQFLTARA